MFTGVIEELGRIRGLSKMGSSYRLDVESERISKGVKTGESVSVDGVCLTVTERSGDVLSFDVVKETAERTSLKGLKRGDSVNLEGAVKAGGAFGGHFVLGHIDCEGRIERIGKERENSFIEFEVPEGFQKYIMEKGSIAIDGISLTVSGVKGNRFKTYLIPHTLKVTNLGAKRAGESVNVEFDIIGKYIVGSRGNKITESFLKENGFCGIV